VLGYKPRLPCPRHGYPGYKPGALVTNQGALDISRVSNCLVTNQDFHALGMGTLVTNLGSSTAWLQTKTSMPQAWVPWLQTRGPGYKPGALVTNLGSSTAWLQTKTSMPQAWVPWLQTRGPGYKPRVFNCLVTNQDFHAPGMGTLVTNQGPWLQT
jgi:hypothetical protein